MGVSRTPTASYINDPTLLKGIATQTQPTTSTQPLPNTPRYNYTSKQQPASPVSSTAHKMQAKLHSQAEAATAINTTSIYKPLPSLPLDLNKPLPEKPLPNTPNPMKSTLNRFRAKFQTKVASVTNKTVLDLVKTTNRQDKGSLSNSEMIQILSNTVKQYKLPDGSAAKNKIDEYANELKRQPEFFKLDQKKLSNMVRVIGEEIHKSQHAINPQLSKTSDAQRETARMPTECMVQWMSVMDECARKNTDPAQKEALQNLLVAAQDQWEERRLSFKDTREYFDKATAECDKLGLPRLASLAGKLKAEMPGPEHDNLDVNKEDLKYKTRLHANEYGRVYSSAFAEALAKDPPIGVKESSYRFGNALADSCLMPKSMNDADKAQYGPIYQQHIEQIQASLIKDQRSWTNQSPLFKAFVEEKDPAKNAYAFEKLLRSPKETGFDCMVIPYIAVKTFLSSPWAPPDWRRAADTNYMDAIVPQNQRLENNSDVVNQMDSHRQSVIQEMMAKGMPAEEIDAVNTKYLSEITAAREMIDKSTPRTADSGATLPFQPAAIRESWMDPNQRVSSQSRLCFS